MRSHIVFIPFILLYFQLLWINSESTSFLVLGAIGCYKLISRHAVPQLSGEQPDVNQGERHQLHDLHGMEQSDEDNDSLSSGAIAQPSEEDEKTSQ